MVCSIGCSVRIASGKAITECTTGMSHHCARQSKGERLNVMMRPSPNVTEEITNGNEVMNCITDDALRDEVTMSAAHVVMNAHNAANSSEVMSVSEMLMPRAVVDPSKSQR